MDDKNDTPHIPAVQRLEAALARIAAPELEGAKVFTEVFVDTARREAEESDRRLLTGQMLGPLDGRIISVKALFDIAEKVTSAGSTILRNLPPAAEDAVVVKRLRAAGAIIIGKTQMTEFAFSALGTNPHDGTPGNPRDRARVPGGSSSGAAVSVADGMAEIAIGSDTGGSIRIPAALSGAVGFKPTSGRIPTQGAFSLSTTLDTIGPIAPTVTDCAIVDRILAGEDERGNRPVERGSFRLIVARGKLFERCEPDVFRAFEDAIGQIRGAGEIVEDGSLDTVLDKLAAIDTIGTFPSIEVGATLRDLGFASLEGVDPKTRARIEAGAGIHAVDYVRMARQRQAAVQIFERSMGEDDVFVLPTVPIYAPLLSSVEESVAFHEANGLVLRNPRIANLLDCPSISLPVPNSDLPVGLMLIGRRNSDKRLLEIALRVGSLLACD